MPSGSEILAALDRRLGMLRRDADTLGEQFRREGDELAEARHAELAVYAALARLRLEKIESGELLRCLDDADRRVGEILQVRKAAEESLADELAAAQRALAATESERSRQQAVVAAAARAADEAELEAKARLDSNEEYRSKLAVAQQAHAIAEHAAEKAAAAEQDRIGKAKPYEADPVFSYLWRKGYGTSRYRAAPLIRTLDAAVARASGYERLRRNYSLLQEIPWRLAEHAQRMRRKASESLSAARALETEAAAAVDLPAKRNALAEAQRRLAEIDRAVDEHEAALDAATEKRARFAAGDDEHSTRCTELLVQALQRADIRELRKKAVRTATAEDDRLVAELERLEQERARRQQELIRLRRLHQAHRERTLGLEEVRRRFKHSRFDDAQSDFANGPLIDDLLARFVSGSIGVDELWEGIARQRRETAASGPPFGSELLER